MGNKVNLNISSVIYHSCVPVMYIRLLLINVERALKTADNQTKNKKNINMYDKKSNFIQNGLS